MKDSNSRLTEGGSAIRSAKTTAGSKTERAMELYLERLEAGEHPDREKFLADFPEIADELAGQLEALDFLHFTASELAEPESGSSGHELGHRATLGDFRLIKPLGRGGMGIVYEGEQLSLGRRVAVKVLPFAAMLDTKRLKRFRNESRAAASLEHPHIVPVYFVGQERGVHFYAMQLIEGQSLAEVIESLSSKNSSDSDASAVGESSSGRILSQLSPTPISTDRQAAYRTIAILGAQAADALSHAHEQGIIHRDVKPGNLLVDSSGKLWVTDFGLARLEGNDSLTTDGDVLGTVAYMSPEQKSADFDTDARSDIYSLGATLYELVARERPFYRRGDASRSTFPVQQSVPPLSRYDSHVPLDLQTIVMKAMSWESVDRYRTAQAMAKDLRRFAQGQPIVARPPGPLEKLTRWARKHPIAILSSSLLSSLLILVMALGTLLVWRAQVDTREALALSRQREDRVAELLYLSDMERAFQAWESRGVEQARTILGQQVPEAGETDRRGIEWHLLSQLTKPLRPIVLGSHEGSANQLAVFPDGTRVASVGEDQKLRIWDISGESAAVTIDMGKSSVEPLVSVAISPDGKAVATGSDVVLLWNPESGKLIRRLTRFNYNVQSIAFSPNGQRIAAASRYDRVRLLNLSGKLLGEIEDESRHETLEFTPDGEGILVPSREKQSSQVVGLIREWSSDLSEVRTEFRVEEPSEFPDYTLATSSADGTFYALSIRYGEGLTRLVDAETGEPLLRLPLHRDDVSTTAISPDGKFLALGFNDGRIEYWQLERLSSGQFVDPEQTQTLDAHQGKVTSLKFARENQLVSCGADGAIKAWHLNESSVPARTGDWCAFGLAASPDAQFLAYALPTGLNFFPARGGKLHHEIPFPECSTLEIAFSKDGLYVAGISSRNSVFVCRSDGEGSINELPLDEQAKSVCFSPTNNNLVAVTGSGLVTLWELESMNQIEQRSIKQNSSSIHSCCRFSPDGRFLVCGGFIDEIVVMKAVDLKVIRRFAIASNTSQIEFDAAGRLFATSHTDGIIRIWDWPRCELRSELIGHTSSVTRFGFSPDGRTLASNSSDRTTRMWAPREGRSFGVLHRHGVEPYGLAFSADSQFLYVGRSRQDSHQTPGILIFHCDDASSADDRSLNGGQSVR